MTFSRNRVHNAKTIKQRTYCFLYLCISVVFVVVSHIRERAYRHRYRKAEYVYGTVVRSDLTL